MPPPPTTPPKLSIPVGSLVRMGFAATLVAALLYLVVFWQPAAPVVDPAALDLVEPPLVAVPHIDMELLKSAKDRVREERLFLEAEPLSHLLAQSLNVSDEAARALGRPAHMVPLEDLRADPSGWRGRWLFYRGRVETLGEPRPGHPVPGYSIYDATLRLSSGEAVLFTFSKPPNEGVHIGGFARAEGFLLKLRDTALPTELTQAPMLVGAELRADFEDWGPVEQLDRERLSHIIDTKPEGDRIMPSTDSWRTIDDDQNVPLWHLGAYARDAAPRTRQEWRQVPALASQEVLNEFRRNEVERGRPMRVMGMLASMRTIRAQPNPAGIEEWTEAWLQVRDVGGRVIPVWVPKAVNVPLGSSLEVRAYYYRRLAYETRSGKEMWTPLFVAADLDPFVFDTSTGMREIGAVVLCGAVALIAVVVWSNLRERRRVRASEDALSARRRRRRDRLATAGQTS